MKPMGKNMISEDQIEAVARAILIARFGDDAKVFYQPVPEDFPEAAKARQLFTQRMQEAYVEARAAIEAISPATTHLDWSGFQGIKINKEWMPDDQELIYTALGVYEGNGDMDDDAKEQIIERLLAAWQRSSSPSPAQGGPIARASTLKDPAIFLGAEGCN